MINRRRFFSNSALAAGATMAFPMIAVPAEKLGASPGQRPGRIIHLVADGMSAGTLTCADYLSSQTRQRGLAWTKLLNQPNVRMGLMNMRSLNSMVTDSSAASSSWGSGSRVMNGALNELPSGKTLTPLYDLFAQLGWKRGLVTTTELTHATPAGFAASNRSRNDATDIADQYLESRVDVLLGGGQKFFNAKNRKDKRDLRGEFAAAGYCVMDTAGQLNTADEDRAWLGMFSDSHLPYTLDWMGDAELRTRVPHLATMTRRALDWLGRHEHFILQVEGGRVDHAAHNCDAAGALRDMIAFDEALEIALEFQRQRPDTLVVVTTDHGNGNMGVSGTGSGYGQSSPMFQRVAEVKASFADIMGQLKQRPASTARTEAYVPSTSRIQEVLLETTGYKVSDRRAAGFQTFLAGKGVCTYDAMNSDMTQLGQLLANHIAVGWISSAHTADYVPIAALGPGAERFCGLIQNTEVFRHYTQLANIDFQNPTEPLMAFSGPEAGDVEKVTEYA